MNNTIALCIPAFNAEIYLPRLLKSAINQKVPFDEILVYNDCSMDNTAEVAKQYGATVINGEVNRGCSFGKNKLAEVAKSEWLHFHDADDELYPNFVETAEKWISKNDCPDVVLFSYEYREHETGSLLSVTKFDSEKLKKDPVEYVINNKIVSICGIYNRSKVVDIGGYDIDPDVLFNEDEAFHHKLARSGFSFDADNAITVINYRLNNSMSADNQLKCAISHYHVLRKTAEQVEQKYHTSLSIELRKTAGILASFLDWEHAYKALELALKLDNRSSIKDGNIFKYISMINPYLALRVREYFIRAFKPNLRKN